MQKSKPSSQTQGSAIRPVTISSNFKFDKVEKLNQIVQEVELGRKETVSSECQTRGERGAVSEKVLDVLKRRIKTNYEQLYSNYPDNKTKILKQIQTVESNISGQNVMKHKQEEIIKEKAKYDKLKVAIEEKQRKLKKLYDLKAQLTERGKPSVGLSSDHPEKHQQYLQKKEDSEHNNLIASEMLKQRKIVLLTLQKRYNDLTEELKFNKQKSEKWRQSNIKRKELIVRLEEILRHEQAVQIPGRLAEELSSKIEQYENKHSYSNIIHHETILEEKRFQKMRQEVLTRKEEQRLMRMVKQKQQKMELQELYNENLANHMEQNKIMRLCGVQSIEEILDSDPNEQRDNLEEIDRQIENQINNFEQSNDRLEKEIEMLMTDGQIDKSQNTVEELTVQLQDSERERKLIQSQLQKGRALSNRWQTIMHILNNNKSDRTALEEIINSVMNPHTTRSLQKSVEVKRSKQSYGLTLTESIDFQ